MAAGREEADLAPPGTVPVLDSRDGSLVPGVYVEQRTGNAVYDRPARDNEGFLTEVYDEAAGHLPPTQYLGLVATIKDVRNAAAKDAPRDLGQ